MSNTDVNMRDLELELKWIKQEAEGMVKQMRELVEKNYRLRHAEKAEAIEGITSTVNEAFYDLKTDVEDEIERREEAYRIGMLEADESDLRERQY